MGVKADGTYPCRSFYVWPLAAQFQAGRFDPYIFSILQEVAHVTNLSRVKLHPIRVVSVKCLRPCCVDRGFQEKDRSPATSCAWAILRRKCLMQTCTLLSGLVWDWL